MLPAVNTELNGYEVGFIKSQTQAAIRSALQDIAIYNAEVSISFGCTISTITGVLEQQGSKYRISVLGKCKKIY